jgi:hypothetical protein
VQDASCREFEGVPQFSLFYPPRLGARGLNLQQHLPQHAEAHQSPVVAGMRRRCRRRRAGWHLAIAYCSSVGDQAGSRLPVRTIRAQISYCQAIVRSWLDTYESISYSSYI